MTAVPTVIVIFGARPCRVWTLGSGGTSMGSSTVRFESSTTIRRPADAVFERLADLPDYGLWMHRTGLFRRSGLTSEGPIHKGAAYFDATRMGTFHGEVTGFEPPTWISFQETLRWFGSPAMQARVEYFLDEDHDRTIVHQIAVGELFGWMRFMKPAAALLAKVERTRTVESLRRSLESGRPRASGTWMIRSRAHLGICEGAGSCQVVRGARRRRVMDG